jgi:hypothetical protein
MMNHREERHSFCYPVLVLKDLLMDVVFRASDAAGAHFLASDNEILEWLPKGVDHAFMFEGAYPDQANIAQRRMLHALFGNDPESLTPDGQAAAKSFAEAIAQDRS